MRCADGSMDGQKRPSSYERVAEAKLLVLCPHRVDARDIATPLADVIVVLRKVLHGHFGGEPVCVPVRASPRPCRASVL